MSAGWTLYKPQKLFDLLVYDSRITAFDFDIKELDEMLEQTGFNKAVRIREKMIRRKCQLLQEQKEIEALIRKTEKNLKDMKRNRHFIQSMLLEIRNILRISREKP